MKDTDYIRLKKAAFAPKRSFEVNQLLATFGSKQTLEVLKNVFKLGADIQSCITINLNPVFTHNTICAHARKVLRTEVNVIEEPTRKLAVLLHANARC